MQKIKVLALFGESGAGKDTIQHWLEWYLKDAVHGIVSYTTRPRRSYEVEGRDYYFISEDKFFNQMENNKILEFTCFNGWFYGTSVNELKKDKINIGVFNPQGVRSLLAHLDIIEVLPVWIKANDKQRLLRSLKREICPDCAEICRRFLADQKDFQGINFEYEFFLNDTDTDYWTDFFNRPKIAAFLKDKND